MRWIALLSYVAMYNKWNKCNKFGSSDEEVMGCNGILAGGFLDISNRMWSLVEILHIIAIDSRKFRRWRRSDRVVKVKHSKWRYALVSAAQVRILSPSHGFFFCVFFSHFLASNDDGARPFFVVLDWGRSPKEICNFGVNDLVVFLSDPTLVFDGQYYFRSTLPKSSCHFFSSTTKWRFHHASNMSRLRPHMQMRTCCYSRIKVVGFAYTRPVITSTHLFHVELDGS